jgi:hypothetical protein
MKEGVSARAIGEVSDHNQLRPGQKSQMLLDQDRED